MISFMLLSRWHCQQNRVVYNEERQNMLCDLRLQNDLAEKRKNVKFIKENCDDIDLAL